MRLELILAKMEALYLVIQVVIRSSLEWLGGNAQSPIKHYSFCPHSSQNQSPTSLRSSLLVVAPWNVAGVASGGSAFASVLLFLFARRGGGDKSWLKNKITNAQGRVAESNFIFQTNFLIFL